MKQVAHLGGLEPVAGLHSGATTERRCKALQAVRQSPEPTSSQIGHQFIEAPPRVEPRVRVRDSVNHHRKPPKRLNFVTDTGQQLLVQFDGLDLIGRQIDGQWQQEPLCCSPPPSEFTHGLLVQHPLVRRVLVHDRQTIRRFEHDVGVEDLEKVANDTM